MSEVWKYMATLALNPSANFILTEVDHKGLAMMPLLIMIGYFVQLKVVLSLQYQVANITATSHEGKPVLLQIYRVMF